MFIVNIHRYFVSIVLLMPKTVIALVKDLAVVFTSMSTVMFKRKNRLTLLTNCANIFSKCSCVTVELPSF